MLEFINLVFGIITLAISLILFIRSFFQKSQEYHPISAESLRLVSVLQFLGGSISIAGSQTQALIPSYAYTIVGASLIITSWALFAGLRTAHPKRKQKPDHYT